MTDNQSTKESKWNNLSSDKVIEKTVESLKANGMNAVVAENKEEALKKVLEILPLGSEVFTLSSETLNEIGLPKEINESGKYNSVRKKLSEMDRETQGRDMQKLGSAPEYAVGSVHALTEDGKLIIVSNTGSQLASEAYGSSQVILVVGSQKIVKNLDDAMKRVYDYVLPLESARANKAYNMTAGSYVSKILIINREFMPNRIHVIIVKDKLGF